LARSLSRQPRPRRCGLRTPAVMACAVCTCTARRSCVARTWPRRRSRSADPMPDIFYTNGAGERVAVSAANPLPVAGGGGGGGMTPADISATAPATWDEDSSTIGVDVGTGASQVAAGDHVHAAGDVTSGTFAAARIPSLAISKVTNLQSELDGKQPAGSYAAASHTHDIADVTGLQSELDGKADT